MMQLKAIFSVLLRRYEFELAQPPGELPGRPLEDGGAARAAVPRPLPAAAEAARPVAKAGERRGGAGAAVAGGLRVRVDRDLCQGHAVCAGEAPEVFRVDPEDGGARPACASEPPAELRAKVEAAVQHCPTRALSSIED